VADARAPSTARRGHARFAKYREGQPTNALDDIWYSSDGVTWNRQAEYAPWAPRSPLVTVFRDQLWIYSGKHTGGPDNWGGDLWPMSAVPGSGVGVPG
jgi:hypothetical protein